MRSQPSNSSDLADDGHSRLPRWLRQLLSPRRSGLVGKKKLGLEILEDRVVPSANVWTDKLDYPPGATVIIGASGFNVGETVKLQVLHIDGTPNTGNGHKPWKIKDGSKKDLDGVKNGSIRTTWYVDPDDSLGATFQLTATGLKSGLVAQTIFTDGPPITVNFTAAAQGGAGSKGLSWRPTGADFVVTARWGMNADGTFTSPAKNPNAYPAFVYQDTLGLGVWADENGNGVVNGNEGGSNAISGGGPHGKEELVFTFDSPVDVDSTVVGVIQLKHSGTQPNLVFTDDIPAFYVKVVGIPNEIEVTKAQLEDAFTSTGGETGFISFSKFTNAAFGPGAQLEYFRARETSKHYEVSYVTYAFPDEPAIELIKDGTLNDANNNGRPDAGETISYSFTVKNTGNVTLTNVTVTDPGITVSGGPIASLAPGATNNSTFTGTYTITQADINAGVKLNTATVTGTPPTGPNVTDTDDHNQPLTQVPSIDLVKNGTLNDANNNGRPDAGETISYTFIVTNTGNVTLTNVAVTDPGITVSGGPIASLAPGVANNSTFTGTYIITQADINAGFKYNLATVTGTPPTGPNVTDADDHNQPLAQVPSIDLVKSGTLNDANNNGAADVGETISYTFIVTNTGNVPLTNVTVTDPGITVNGGPLASLAPGASNNSTFTGTYTVTQEDIDAGVKINTATVTGTPPTGPNVTDTDDHTQDLSTTASILLVKSGVFNDTNNNGRPDPGETISYTFTVTNTGGVTLTNVTVTDPGITVSGGPLASLAPGASNGSTFTGTYTVTQADIDAGNKPNTATATGTPPSGPNVTDTDTYNQPLAQVPSILLVKSGTFNDANNNGRADVGETISYTFIVTNTGNVTLTNVTVTDPGITVSGGPIASLAPGASNNSTFTGTYIITQTDIDAGNKTNTATATGTPPTGPNVTDPDTNVTNLPQQPSILLVKSGTFNDTNNNGRADVGETISYTFIVTNTGNVTLTNVTVADPGITVSGGPLASLAPGASNNSTFTGTYIITQADINAGNKTNTATATGTPPTGPNVTDPDTNVTNLPQSPGIDIQKSGVFNDQNGDGNADVGETISYTFIVTNTGNVTLTNVVVTDPGVTVSGGPLASLAPGASNNNTFTATYVITQADINAGSKHNTATVRGTPPTGPNVTDTDQETVTLPQPATIAGTKFKGKPALEGGYTLVKPLSGWKFLIYLDNGNGIFDAGDTKIGNTTSNAAGDYIFSNLAAGTYHIREKLQDGWTKLAGNATITVQNGEVWVPDAGSTSIYPVPVGQENRYKFDPGLLFVNLSSGAGGGTLNPDDLSKLLFLASQMRRTTPVA